MSGHQSASKEQILHVAKMVRDNPSLKGVLTREDQQRVELILEQGQIDYVDSDFHTLFPDTGPLRRELYPRHLAFFEAGAYARERGLIAANRSGKSKAGAYELVCHLTGLYPSWWKGRRFDGPVDCWAVGKTWGTVKEIINKELFGRIKVGRKGRNEIVGDGMIPRDLVVHETASFNTQLGQLVSSVAIRHVTSKGRNPKYSWIGLKSAEQGRSAYEGAAKHVVWGDEEMPEDVYHECLIRTMTTDGIMYLTFTPLDGITSVVTSFLPEAQAVATAATEQWTMHEGFGEALRRDEERAEAVQAEERPDLLGVTWLNPQKAHISLAWKHGIPHLTKKAMAEYMASIPHHQREARMEGKPALGVGRIYPMTWDDVSYTPFLLPDSWPQCFALDPGYNVTAAVAMALDPATDTIYVWGTYRRAQATVSVNIAALQDLFPWQPGVVDPAAGGRNQSDGERIIDQYSDKGMDLLPADNSVEAGILAVYDRLVSGRLRFAAHLGELEYEFGVYRRDEKGRVVKEQDHLMDAVRYGVMTGIHMAKTKMQVEHERRGRPALSVVRGTGLIADPVAGF